MDTVERHLARLTEIEREAGQILLVTHELEAGSLVGEMERFEQKLENFPEMTAEVYAHWDAVKGWLGAYLPGAEQRFTSVRLYAFVEKAVENAGARAPHRAVHLEVKGDPALRLRMNSQILREVVDGLIKNAVENTPDGGKIEIVLEEREQTTYLHVRDYGVGITNENRLSLFDGLAPARETELYASKRPYEFGAGGEGLDLLRMKLYAERFGFSVSAESTRCSHVPTDQDQCPGKISLCGYCRTTDNCAASRGSTFRVAFPVLSEPWSV